MKKILVILIFIALGGVAWGQIPLGSNFGLTSGIPLDNRTAKADLTERDAIPAVSRYEGLTVYVESEEAVYTLVGGITNSDWVEGSAGGTSTDSTWVSITVTGDIINDAIYKAGLQSGFVQSDTIVYINSTSGSDVTGDGTSGNPFETFGKAMSVLPGYADDIVGLHIHLQAGNYNWSDFAPYLRGNTRHLVITGDVVTEGTTLANITTNGDYEWTTTTAMTPGEFAGDWVLRNNAALFGHWIMFPIYDNTTYGFTTPKFAQTTIPDGRIANHAAVINVDIEYNYEINNVNFRAVKFTCPTTFDLLLCRYLNFTFCEFEATDNVYETVSLWNSRYCNLQGCMIKHDPSSSAGDAAEFNYGYYCGVASCVILNTDLARRCQGIEFNSGFQAPAYDNIIDGFGLGYHVQISSVHLGGNKFNDLDAAIGVEEEGFSSIEEAAYNYSDSLVLTDVTYFLSEGTANNAGRLFKYPSAKLGGTFTFSSTYTNHSYSLEDNIFIQVGLDDFTASLDGDLEATSYGQILPATINMDDYYNSGYYTNGLAAYSVDENKYTVIPNSSNRGNVINYRRDSIYVDDITRPSMYELNDIVYNGTGPDVLTDIRHTENVMQVHDYNSLGDIESYNFSTLLYPDEDTISARNIRSAMFYIIGYTPSPNDRITADEINNALLYSYLDDGVQADSLILLELLTVDAGIPDDSLGAYYGIYHNGSGITPQSGRDYFLYSEQGDIKSNGGVLIDDADATNRSELFQEPSRVRLTSYSEPDGDWSEGGSSITTQSTEVASSSSLYSYHDTYGGDAIVSTGATATNSRVLLEVYDAAFDNLSIITSASDGLSVEDVIFQRGIVYGGDYSTAGVAYGDNWVPSYGAIRNMVYNQLTGSLTDGAPTDAEIDTVTGTTPSAVGAGWAVTIKDNDGTGLLYRIESDGTNWFYMVMTQAL